MKSNAERMSLVFARAKKIKYCRETKKLNFCKVGNRLAFRSFAVLHRIISDIVQKCGGCPVIAVQFC